MEVGGELFYICWLRQWYMRRFFYLLMFGATCGLMACETDTAASQDWPELNLLQYEVPVKVRAPEGTSVKSDNLGILQDVTLTGPDGYHVQLYVAEALGMPAAEVLQEQRKEVESMRYFAAVTEEFPDAFLFRVVVDTSQISYDFRHVKVVGNKEMVFQTGLTSNSTEAEAKAMLAAIREE